jgi:hypothetical protein
MHKLEKKLRARIGLYLQEAKRNPMVFKRRYKLESLAEEVVAS